MGTHNGAYIKGACLALAAVALAGCAAVEPARVVKPGDSVGVRFTCLLPSGEIAVSTRGDAGKDAGERLSPLFVARETSDPVVISAGAPDPLLPTRIRPLEEDVLQQLRGVVLAMKQGETRSVDLHASVLPDRKPTDGIVKYNRTRHYSKEDRVPLAIYKQATGRDPVIGEACAAFREPVFKGVVAAIEDDKVVVRYTVAPVATVQEFFGTGTITDAGDDFVKRTDAEEGRLVRSGFMSGRIVKVTKETVHIDFGDQFGGEPLKCSVTVDSVAPAPPPAEVKGAATPNRENEGAKQAQLKAAMAEAVKSGKSSVNIDLDELPGLVAKGDLVTVRFTARNSDGTPLSLPAGSATPDTPQELMAGKEEIFPGLGEAVIGMTVGEKKEVTLSPEQAFGLRDPAKIESYPVKSETPTRITLPAEEYVKSFGGFPTVGKEVPLIPYVKTRVESVGDKDVTLAITAKDGESFSEPFGTVTVSAGSDAITLTLAPKPGAPFASGNRQGVITASDSEKFTVDYNDPLAGKTIVLDLEALSLTKAAALQGAPIDWIEEYGPGLAEAKKENKPLFLLLYADWCGWCKKTMTETLPDPRILQLKDRFVWTRVNSDKEKKYKEMYGQSGFPMIVLLHPDGTVARKFEGFRGAAALAGELRALLH